MVKKMTSNDNYVTVEIFNNGIQEVNQRFDKLENLINTGIRVNEVAHSYLQTSVYWGFAIIAFVVALVGLNPFKKEKIEKKSEWSERDLRALIREEISMANSAVNE